MRKYFAIYYITRSYHSQDGHLMSCGDVDDIEDAIKMSVEISEKYEILNRISIVSDNEKYEGCKYVYPNAGQDHENWHGEIVKTFTPKFIPNIGMGGYFSWEGIDNINNWK